MLSFQLLRGSSVTIISTEFSFPPPSFGSPSAQYLKLDKARDLFICCIFHALLGCWWLRFQIFFYMKSQITQTWLEILTLYSNSLSLRSEFQWSYPALPRTLPSTHFQVPSVFTAPIQTLFLNPEMNFCHEHVNKQSGPKLICCHTGKDIHMVLSWFVSYTTELCCYGLSSISLKYSNISLFYFPSVYFLG